MSKVYATTDDGRKFLVEIACDGCGAVLKPGADVDKSGWEKRGATGRHGERFEWFYCPNCQGERR